KRFVAIFSDHPSDEAISPPRHSLDIALRSLLVSERFAQRRNVYRQDSFLDERFRPDPRQEFLFCHQASLLPNEFDKHIVCFGRKPHDFGPAQQTTLPDVQSELAKAKDFPVDHHLSANLSKTLGTPPAGGC